MSRPLLVAITGDIAAGKTLATSFYEQFDDPVISADDIVKDLLKEPEVIKEIKKQIKGDFIDKGSINRSKLRQIVFNDPIKLKILNDIIHPRVLKILAKLHRDFIYHSHHTVVFFEIPLLFECNLEKCFDLNMLVVADDEDKINRITKRDNCSRTIAQAILDNQMPQSKKMKKADLVITNTRNVDFLYTQLAIFYVTFKFIRKRKVRLISDK